MEAKLVEAKETIAKANSGERKIMYTFNWIGGGFNQVMAFNDNEAIIMAREKECEKLNINWNTFKACLTKAETDSWNKNFQGWD